MILPFPGRATRVLGDGRLHHTRTRSSLSPANAEDREHDQDSVEELGSQGPSRRAKDLLKQGLDGIIQVTTATEPSAVVIS